MTTLNAEQGEPLSRPLAITFRIAAIQTPPGVAFDRSELVEALQRQLRVRLGGAGLDPACALSGSVAVPGGSVAVPAPVNADSAARALAEHIHARLREQWGPR